MSQSEVQRIYCTTLLIRSSHLISCLLHPRLQLTIFFFIGSSDSDWLFKCDTVKCWTWKSLPAFLLYFLALPVSQSCFWHALLCPLHQEEGNPPIPCSLLAADVWALPFILPGYRLLKSEILGIKCRQCHTSWRTSNKIMHLKTLRTLNFIQLIAFFLFS